MSRPIYEIHAKGSLMGYHFVAMDTCFYLCKYVAKADLFYKLQLGKN